MLLGSILLALAWAALQGDFSLASLLIGYVLGYLVLVGLGRGGVIPSRFEDKLRYLIELAVFALWGILVANIRVALDVARPRAQIRPAIVAIPLDVTSDGEILLLSALINITPGSVTIDVSEDRRTLYVHVMNVESVDETRREIKEQFERRVHRLLG
jgi:multicomponent Na+:H+ antiporter subunit E